MPCLNLDTWWDEPDYTRAKGTLSTKGAFILRKLMKHDGARFVEVMADLYRDDAPDPQDITKFEWQTILAYMGERARRRSPTCRSGWGGCGGKTEELGLLPVLVGLLDRLGPGGAARRPARASPGPPAEPGRG